MLDTLILQNPIKIDGCQVKKLDFDFEELTINDFMRVEKLLKKSESETMSFKLNEFDSGYQFETFVQAVIKSNPSYSEADVRRVKGRDARKAAHKARAFLLNSYAEESEESKTSDISAENIQ